MPKASLNTISECSLGIRHRWVRHITVPSLLQTGTLTDRALPPPRPISPPAPLPGVLQDLIMQCVEHAAGTLIDLLYSLLRFDPSSSM